LFLQYKIFAYGKTEKYSGGDGEVAGEFVFFGFSEYAEITKTIHKIQQKSQKYPIKIYTKIKKIDKKMPRQFNFFS